MGMKFHHAPFQSRVEEGVKNSFMRSAVSGAQERLYHRKLEATNQLGDWEAWRNHAEEIRQHVLENLDYYLYTLSENVAKRGGSVFFAKTPDEANAYIAEVIEQQQGKKVVKSKSMVTEEINLNAHLEKRGIEVVETDLGEYILQLDEHDPPSHIVAPALHKNKEQIRDVFQEKLSYTGDASPKNLAQFARKTLRADFLTADVGITGCNFAVAETGSVCLVTNEGNADLVTSIPKTVISVMGMERVVPTFKELEILVGMLTRSAVGQKLTSYITVLTGTKLEQEIDGPENFHLVILDNGRSEILGGEFQSVLQCIRCAACINVCPVYRHIGGHSYGSIYPGPIGAVLSPLLGGYEDFKELPYASTLCGACTEACPVKIPLHELLHKHRAKIVEKEGAAPFGEKFLMKLFGIGASSPNVYGFGSKIASTAMKPLVSKNNSISKGPGPLKDWTKYREFPSPSRTRFRDWFEAYAEGERKDEKSDN